MSEFKQAAGAALEFLKRTDLKGVEWRTFGAVFQFLEGVAQGALTVAVTEAPKAPEQPKAPETPPEHPPSTKPKPLANGKEAP